MNSVHEGDQHRWGQYDQEKVTQKEIGRPQRHLHDLHDELSSGLRHSGCSKSSAIPFAGPPSTIGLIMLEFTSKEHRNQEFLNSTLDGNNGDNTKDGMGSIPEFQEPLV